MMDSAIDETQGAQKDEPLSTFTRDLNRALPYKPPTMPTFKEGEGDSGSDDELKDIAAKSSQ